MAKKTELEQLKEGIAAIAENVLILDAAISELKSGRPPSSRSNAADAGSSARRVKSSSGSSEESSRE